MKILKVSISLFLLFLSVVSYSFSDDKVEAPVRFVVMGDRTGGHVPGIWGQIVDEVQRLRPDFVCNVGDMIEGYTDDTLRIINEWAEFDSLCSPFTMPFYRTPGNHDILDSVDEAWYRKLVGEPYYSVDYGDIHLIFMDNPRWDSSTVFFTSPEAVDQIAWLALDLKAHQDAKQTFVFMHKPYWYYTLSYGKPDPLHDLFKIYGVDAVFSGHFHDYFVGEYDGIIYTGIGSSGGGTDPAPNGLHYHYAWVTVDNDGIHIAPIKHESVLAWDAITVEELKTYTPIEMRGLRFTKSAEVNSDLKVVNAPIELTFDNSSSAFPLKSKIEWEIPEGWTIDPILAEVEAEAGEVKKVALTASSADLLFPTPTAKVEFSYGEGKQCDATGTLYFARQANCQKAGDVIIDGELSDKCWMEGQDVLFHNDGTPMQTEPVRFFFAYDDDNLYLAAYCEDSYPDSIKATTSANDGAVYYDDCVGYFIEPAYGLDTLYQIYINSIGIVYDAQYWIKEDGFMAGTKDWNGDYEIAAKQVDDGWVMETKIPMAQFGMTLKEGDKVRVNFRRKHQRLDAAADWQVPLEWDASTYGELNLK